MLLEALAKKDEASFLRAEEGDRDKRRKYEQTFKGTKLPCISKDPLELARLSQANMFNDAG
jgi:hypothetical protein